VGFLFVTYFSDNYGRKKTVTIAWSISIVGCFFIMLSKWTDTMWTAAVGLTLNGIGADSVVIITGSILSEQCEDVARQKIFSIVQGAFTLGALVITLVFYIWEDWFITITFFLLVPAIVVELGFIFLLKESPLFMIRDDPALALRELNDIGRLNKGDPEILTMRDIENVIEQQSSNEYQETSNALDIFRFGSLRLKTITQSIVNVVTFLMYYGPVLIVSQFGFDIYTSNVILNVADLLTYYPLMLMIDKIKRRKACMIQLGGGSIICGILIFLVAPDDCDKCATIYVQLALIFVFRFLISMEFAIIGIYQAELFPTRIRNIAVGALNVFGTVSSTAAPTIMGVFTRGGINHFILFTVIGIIATGAMSFCPETFGQKCPEEIEEIAFMKMKKTAARRSQMISADKIRK
jgi:MFS family permease